MGQKREEHLSDGVVALKLEEAVDGGVDGMIESLEGELDVEVVTMASIRRERL